MNEPTGRQAAIEDAVAQLCVAWPLFRERMFPPNPYRGGNPQQDQEFTRYVFSCYSGCDEVLIARATARLLSRGVEFNKSSNIRGMLQDDIEAIRFDEASRAYREETDFTGSHEVAKQSPGEVVEQKKRLEKMLVQQTTSEFIDFYPSYLGVRPPDLEARAVPHPENNAIKRYRKHTTLERLRLQCSNGFVPQAMQKAYEKDAESAVREYLPRYERAIVTGVSDAERVRNAEPVDIADVDLLDDIPLDDSW